MRVFIYTDSDCDLEPENVFLSAPYKNVGEFEKLNPGMKCLISYDALEVLTLIANGLKIKEMKKKAR